MNPEIPIEHHGYEQFSSRLKVLLRRISASFFIVQLTDYRIVHVNQQARQLGILEGQFCYQVNCQNEAPCDCPADECWVKAYRDHSKDYNDFSLHAPYCVHTSYGTITASPLPCPSGELDQLIFSVVSTNELENLVKDGVNTFERYRAFFDQSHDAIFNLDLEGNHLAANKQACQLLGYSETEIVNYSYKDISAELEESSDVLDILLSGHSVPYYERKFKKKNGEMITVEVNVELISHPDGSPWFIQSIIRDISDRKKRESDLETQAMTDVLTGLYNRRYFSKRLELLYATKNFAKSKHFFLFLDIDKFKMINDQYGHDVGDDILRIFGKRLKHNFRTDDLICRFGGDEFLVLIEIDDPNSLFTIIDRFFADISSPVMTSRGQIQVTTSIGVAEIKSNKHFFEVVFSEADQALYEAKAMSGNSYVFHSKK